MFISTSTIILIIFICVLAFVPYFDKIGLFLNKNFKPYLKEINKILQPYKSCEFAKNIQHFAVSSLKNHNSSYKYYKKTKRTPSNNYGIEQYIYDLYNNKHNTDITKIWAELFIYSSLKKKNKFDFSDNEHELAKTLEQTLAKRIPIIKQLNDCPKSFLYQFDIEK